MTLRKNAKKRAHQMLEHLTSQVQGVITPNLVFRGSSYTAEMCIRDRHKVESSPFISDHIKYVCFYEEIKKAEAFYFTEYFPIKNISIAIQNICI